MSHGRRGYGSPVLAGAVEIVQFEGAKLFSRWDKHAALRMIHAASSDEPPGEPLVAFEGYAVVTVMSMIMFRIMEEWSTRRLEVSI